MDAFERYDIDALVELLHEDAIQSMPPFAMWLRGADDICTWMARPVARECEGSRLLPVRGQRVRGVRPVPGRSGRAGTRRGRFRCSRSRGGRITGIHAFLDTAALFPAFGLPAHLP